MNVGTTQIWNTPGYYYAIAYWMSTAVIIHTNDARRGIWKSLAAELAALGIMLGFMKATANAQGAEFLLSMCVIIVDIFLLLWFLCDLNMTTLIFCTAKAFIAGELCASLCWQIVFHFYEGLDGFMRNIWMLAIYMVLGFGLFFLERYMNRDIKELHMTWKEIVIVILLTLATYIMSNIGYVDRDSLFSGSGAADVFNVRTLIDLSGFSIIYAYQLQLREVRARFEKDTLRNIMDMQYKSYQLSKESMDVVNQKYHDLKHQIAVLKSETDSAKVTKKLERMEAEIQVYETQNRTGNRVLDVVLAVKSLYCQKHGIELKFITDGKLLDFMDETDISALFGNMLDNAIESVEKQEDEQKRMIRLYISEEKNFLRIRTENYCEEDMDFRGGLPVTTKKDKQFHGFGMKSMQKTVEHYGGSIRATRENNWFTLMILIPLR